jgi:hypothetical protein
VPVWIDPKAQLLMIDASSAKRAEEAATRWCSVSRAWRCVCCRPRCRRPWP